MTLRIDVRLPCCPDRRALANLVQNYDWLAIAAINFSEKRDGRDPNPSKKENIYGPERAACAFGCSDKGKRDIKFAALKHF